MRELSARHIRVAVTLITATLLLAGCFQPAGSNLQPTTVNVTDLTPDVTVETALPTPLPTENLTPFVTPIPTEGLPTPLPPTPEPPTPTPEVATPERPTPDPQIAQPVPTAGPSPTPTLSIPTLPAVDATPTSALPPTPTAIPLPTENPCEYTIKLGDYPYAVARKLGINPVDLIAANPGVQNRILQPGDKLRIPNCNPQAQQPSPPPPPPAEQPTNPPAAEATQPPPDQAVAPTPIILTERIYTVAPGDTLGGIGRKFGVTVQALMQANGLTGDFLRVGQQLKIPAPGQ